MTIRKWKVNLPVPIENSRSPEKLSNEGRLTFLLKDSVIYGGAAALSKAFSLITFPLIARHFSTADYGTIDLLGVFASFLGILIVFGQDSAVARFFYEYEEITERRCLISQALLFQLITFSLLAPILWFFSTELSIRLINVTNAEYLFKLITLQMPFIMISNFSQNILKWSFGRSKFLIISLGSTATSLALIVIGILCFDIDIADFFFISLFNYVFFGLLGLWFVKSWLIIPSDMRYLRELLPYAFPLGVVCSVGALVPTLERWLTLDLLGAEDLGLYASGVRFAMLLTLVIGAFQTAWGPFSLSIHKQENAIKTYNTVLKAFVFFMTLFVYFLSAVSYHLLVLLASERYAMGVVVIFPLAMALVIQGTGWITEIGIGISKKSSLYLYPYIAYVAFTILGIYLFASWFGLIGVALGVLTGHFAKATYTTWVSQDTYPMKWDFSGVIIFLLSATSYGLLTLWLINLYGLSKGFILFGMGFVAFTFIGTFLLFTRLERLSLLSLSRSMLGVLAYKK